AFIMNGHPRRPVYWLGAVLALCVAPLSRAPVLAQAGGGIVTGRVIDARSEQPIPNAQVTSEQRGARTDRDGRYRLSGVPAGNRTVLVRMVGYAATSKTLQVAEGLTATADFA